MNTEKPKKIISISAAPDTGHIDSIILSLVQHMIDAELRKGAEENARKEATKNA